MRTVLLKAIVFFFCFCCAGASVFAAKDLYLSATGNDANDGLTNATAVKTLGRIHALIGVGDIIHISGIIDISQEVKGGANEVGTNLYQPGGEHWGGFFFTAGVWHNSKMIGTNPDTDGFDAKSGSRIFRIDGGTHSFENLSFTGGADIVNDGGSGLWLRSSTCTFTNCTFTNNAPLPDAADPTKFVNTNGRGGAFHITNASTVFYNCYFAENANTMGGALFIMGGTVSAIGCVFEYHDLSLIGNSDGGAIYMWNNGNPIVNIDRCIFQNNAVARDGGAIAMKNLTERENFKTVLNITNSAFVRNESFGTGGAFYLNNTRLGTNDSITIANTTFFGNVAEREGGALYLGNAQPNSLFTMVNTSVIANYTRGNGGFGAGLTVNGTNDSKMLKRIYNSIFDKNSSVSQGIYSDLLYRLPEGASAPGTNSDGEKELIIANTYISTTLSGNGVTANWLTNENYPGNDINYTSVTHPGDDWIVDYVNASGIDDDPEYYLQQSDFPVYAIPLQDDAPARTFGNAEYLTTFGIAATDQLGKERVVEGSACAVGASEATQAEIEDGTFEDYPYYPTGIVRFRPTQPGNAFAVSGDIVSLIQQRPDAALTLYGLTGSLLRRGNGQLSIAGLPGGVYIVRAQVAGQQWVQKIVK
jgi:hypothetical protein